MKKNIFLVLLLVFVLLTGCGKKPSAPPAPEPAPAAPVEEEKPQVGLYFTNRADNGFLYTLNRDTMEAAPAVEKKIHNPVFQDGSIYYLNTDLGQVICLSMESGEETVLAENVGWFRLEGENLLYGRLSADVTESYFSLLSLPSGESTLLLKGNYSLPALCNGWVYYSAEVDDAQNPENSTLEIRAYNCASGKTDVPETLSAERETVSRMYCVGDCAFYCVNGVDWHTLRDGARSEEPWGPYLSNQITPMFIEGDRVLYIFDGQCPDGRYRSRLCMQENGGETILLEGSEEGENIITQSRMAEDLWAIELHHAILSEDDGEIHHSFAYYLLTADGVLTPITGTDGE